MVVVLSCWTMYCRYWSCSVPSEVVLEVEVLEVVLLVVLP